LQDLYNWGRKNSVWPLQFGLACCAIEMIASTMARYDLARFGAEVFRPSPRQADLMIVAGTVTKKMAPQVVRLYNQMPNPNMSSPWAPAPFPGAPSNRLQRPQGDRSLYPRGRAHPGCPPRPEALIHAFMTLQKKIAGQDLTGENRPRHLDARPPANFPCRDSARMTWSRRAIPKCGIRRPWPGQHERVTCSIVTFVPL